MKQILTILLLLILTNIQAQTSEAPKVLIADETYQKTSEKTITISTTNETIKQILFTRYNTFDRMSMYRKKDRNGEYWQYSFSYKKELFIPLKL